MMEPAIERARAALSPAERAVFDATFLAEVERRAGATREEMLFTADKELEYAQAKGTVLMAARWLRSILGGEEKP